MTSSRYGVSVLMMFFCAIFVYKFYNNITYYGDITVLSSKIERLYTGNTYKYVWNINYEYTSKDGCVYGKNEIYPLAIKHVYEKTGILPGIKNDDYQYGFMVASIMLGLTFLMTLLSLFVTDDYDEMFFIFWGVLFLYFMIMVMVMNLI